MATAEGNASTFRVISFYHIAKIDAPEVLRDAMRAAVVNLDIKGRIYVAPQGVNGQFSAPEADAAVFMQWVNEQGYFEGVDWKIHYYHEHVFNSLKIKAKRELVAMGLELDLADRGQYLTSEEWDKALAERDEKTLLLDVRNEYEWRLGRFNDAIPFSCDTFREFEERWGEIKKSVTPDTRVLMYCTGGIRCELFSALLKKEGLENLFQLKGGVIKYGQEVGAKHWEGQLFVFDDRMAVPLSETEEAPVIASCHYCSQPCELYYNCANMDCNELFICCQECLAANKGCCSETCKTAPRVRPYKISNKPFRRAHLETQLGLECSCSFSAKGCQS